MVRLLHLKITPSNQGQPMIIDNPIKAHSVVLNTVSIRSTVVSVANKELFIRTNFMSSLSNMTTSNIPLIRDNSTNSIWVPKVPISLRQGIISRIDFDIVDSEGSVVNLATENIASIDLLFSFVC